MKTKFNRFAIIPTLCTSCKRYIWLEPYRKSGIWHRYADRFITGKLCKECVNDYLPNTKEAGKDE